MPELIRTERPVVMGDAQRKAYIQLVAQHLAEVSGDEVIVKDAGPRMMKPQQILSGYIADTATKRILTIDEDAPIYDATLDEIEGTFPGKALVWCRYKEDCRRLAAKLRKKRKSVLEYWGDYPTDVREANRAKFLQPDDDSTMIGTPDCGGEGLDFSAADAVIFMSGNPNARMMAQAEERATVKGGKSVSVVRIRHYGTVDDRVWEIVDGNISLADTITGTGLRRLLEATDI
jgi:superfamily II DNA or RNA helicase